MSFDMKYIDAERLREELQKPKTELKVGNYYLDNSEQAVGYENALIDFELLIDSLQQEQDCIVINKKDWKAQEQFKKNKDFGKPLKEEQPKKSKKNCNDCPHCVDRKDQFGWHFKGCFGGPYNGKFIAEIDECPLQQEQPDFPTTDGQMKEFLATHPKTEVPEKYKNPDWLLNKQERQEVDLEKELEIYLDKMNMYVSSDDGKVKCYNGDCVDSEGDYFRVFKAGFELGLKARKEGQQ